MWWEGGVAHPPPATDEGMTAIQAISRVQGTVQHDGNMVKEREGGEERRMD